MRVSYIWMPDDSPFRCPHCNSCATNANSVKATKSAGVGAWNEIARSHHNVLLAGTPCVTSGLIAALLPHLRGPVYQYLDSSLPLPASGALILSEVGALNSGEQTKLLQWLDGFYGGVPVQIVSTTSTSLESLTESGAFDQTLYYRLNTIRFDLTAAG